MESPTFETCYQRPAVPTLVHESAQRALRQLYLNPDLSSTDRKSCLDQLGNKPNKSQRPSMKIRKSIADFHFKVATTFSESNGAFPDENVLDELIRMGDPLQYLLGQGSEDKTVLHALLDPDTYESEFTFDKLKSLIRVLMKIFPKLPSIVDMEQNSPLCSIIKSKLKGSEKAEIIEFLCGDKESGGLASAEAIESLRMRPSIGTGKSSHALHKAIENSVDIDEAIVKRVGNIGVATVEKNRKSQSCLEMWDDAGKTCLHIALTAPLTPSKRRWAKMLVKLKPDLQKVKDGVDGSVLTPLQHFMERKPTEGTGEVAEKSAENVQSTETDLEPVEMESLGSNVKKSRKLYPRRSKMHEVVKPDKHKVDPDMELEDWLRHRCLVEFDNATARSIMYKRGKSRFSHTQTLA
jgi:hypothetical protein